MREKTHYRHFAGTPGRGRFRLKLLTTLLVLSLLAPWLGGVPVTLASEQAHACQEDCIITTDPPNFDLSITPASQTVEQGGATTYAVSINTINCYTGTITLSLAGLPDNTVYVLDPVSTVGPMDSTLTVATTVDTPPGDYELVISGDSGDLHREASVNLVVNAPPPPEPFFTIAASPGSQSVEAGEDVEYTVSLGIRDGFTLALPVSLSVIGLPAGAEATLAPDVLTPPGDSTLTISTAADTPTGTYELTISGDSGELHDETSVNLVVNAPPPPELFFTIAASPDSQTVQAGEGTDYAVSLGIRDGFGTLALPVSLTVTGLPAGAEAILAPDVLTPPGDSALIVTTTLDTPADTYELTVSGDSGELHDETSVTLVVNTPPSQQAMVKVQPASDSMFVGQTTESQIMLHNAHDFYGLEFFMSYDPSVVQVVDADPALAGVQIGLGELFPPNQYTVGVNQVDTATGVISFGVARLAPLPPVNGDGELAVITWEAVGEGQSDLSFTHLKLAAPSGFELEATSQDGAIEVTLTGAVSGEVHMQGRLDHSGAEVTVSPMGLQAITDIQGLFHFLVHGVLTVTAHMYGYLDAQASVEVLPGESVDLGPTTLYGGEVTGDDLIDILDLAYLGARFHTDDLSADINGDGQVDILDLVLAAANYMMSGPTPWAE